MVLRISRNGKMELTKQRWIILLASCLVNICIGSLYAWSVFAMPMAAYLSAVNGGRIVSLSLVFTIANSVGPVTMILGGFFNDKLGPEWVIRAGGLLFSCGMLLSGFAKNTGVLIIGYGIGCGLGMGMIYGCTVSNAVKFFPERRGLVGGIAAASYGISSVIVPPIANALIISFDITATFKIMGLAVLVIILGASLFIKACPPGFIPEGWKPPAAGGKTQNEGKNWKKMLADPVFYVMIGILCCGAFSGMMVISQASPMAQRMVGMPVTLAAIVVSVLALLNTIGRIAAGIVYDKFGIFRTFLGIFLVSLIGLTLLYLTGAGEMVKLILGVSCVGLSFGSIMGIFPGFTAAQFGSKNNSVNYGIMFTGFAAAGFFGPTIVSKIYENKDAYQQAFLVAMGLAVAGLVLSFLYRRIVEAL
jgi:MFS family permease